MIHSSLRLLGAAVLVCMVSAAPAVTAKLCLDPGHGGTDSGATSCGAAPYEKTNVLYEQLRFRDWLNADTNDGAGGGSWTVIMTRSSDISLSLQGRCDVSNANGANRFMSVHNNAFNCSANGTETFCYGGGSATSFDLRDKVQNRMIQAWNRVNRGNKTANFYVLVNTNAPAELAELAFIDSAVDRAYTNSNSWNDVAARHHLYAVQNHFGITAYTPGTGGGYDVILDNTTYFSASANWVTGTSAADKYGVDYRHRPTAALSDKAGWLFNPSSAGTYTCMAWWPAGANRSPAAPYILPNGVTVTRNQQVNGGSWQTLGTANIGAGLNSIELSCWAATGYVVVADAVRMRN